MDKMEARKITVKALRYVVIDGILFLIPYLKCLRPTEAETTLREVHEGICGQHQGGRALAHKVVRLGFYWPTMIVGAKTFVRKCERCQKHAPIV